MRTGAADIANNWTMPDAWFLTTANRTKLAQDSLVPAQLAQLRSASSASFCECTTNAKVLLTEPFVYNHTGGEIGVFLDDGYFSVGDFRYYADNQPGISNQGIEELKDEETVEAAPD
ncbi:hypothetical protein ABPG75_004378 [Micractinium tetrahymenae]